MQIDGTKLTFDLYEVLRNVTPEQGAVLADALALNDAVRKNVIDIMVDGVTDLESWPSSDLTDDERKRLIVGQDEIRDRRISHLEIENSSLTTRLAEAERVTRAIWDVYHNTMQSDFIAKSRIYNALTSPAKT
jgi:hypothetical protein